jgi:hypothetical protein
VRSAWKGGRRTAGVAAAILLAVAGLGSAQALAGDGSGKRVPPTTITVIIPAPTPTVTGTSVTVTAPPSPPPSAPPAGPPPLPQPAPPPPASSTPPPPAVNTPTPAPSPPVPASGDSSPPPQAPPSEASAGTASEVAETRSESSREVASGPRLVKPDALRTPARKATYVGGERSSGSVALDHDAAVLRGGGIRRADLRGPALRGMRAQKRDVLALAGFPHFLKGASTGATGRSGTGLPDVQRVLGDQATVARGGGDGLSFGPLPSVALSLVLLSSLLLVGALLPAGVLARTPLSPARFARFRQPLALAAVAILIPLAVGSLAAALA